MEKPRKIIEEQFEDSVRHLLLNKPVKSAIPDDEPTPETLGQPFRLDSTSSEQYEVQMKGQIVLFGTSHSLQRGNRSEEETYQFRTELERVCHTHNIQLIAEEMVQEVLGEGNTIAWEVAKIRNLKHDYVDLTSKERGILKIEQGDLVNATMYFGRSEDGHQLRDTLTKCLSDPIRERCWYARILHLICRYDLPSTLFVCGADHTSALYNLIESTGMTALIAHRDYPS